MDEIMTHDVEEIGADQADVFDGWDDDSPTEADQPEVDEQTGDEPEEDSAEAQPESEDAPKDDAYLTLKHMDETKTVTKDEAVQLAQKGMDYDRIRTERDELKAYRAEQQPVIDMIQKYAERNGMTIPEYIDFCRMHDIMAEKGVGEDAAKEVLALEKREVAVAQKEAEQAERANAEAAANQQPESLQERARREVQQFQRDFPDVNPEDVPADVFDIVQKDDVSLSVAYGKWRIAQQAKELESFKAQSSARKKTPGSLSGSVKSTKKNPLFEGWDD